MTDPVRVALSTFLPPFLFRFIHPFMPTSTPTTSHRNVHPAICHTSNYPVRSSSSLSHHSKICLFSSHFSSTFWHACRTLHHFSPISPLLSFVFASTSQPVFHFYLFGTQAANHHPKILAIRATSCPPHLILLQASTRTRTCVRLSMYLLPVAVFISHQKEGFVREEEAPEHKKRRS
jgi:hypothetical protein